MITTVNNYWQIVPNSKFRIDPYMRTLAIKIREWMHKILSQKDLPPIDFENGIINLGLLSFNKSLYNVWLTEDIINTGNYYMNIQDEQYVWIITRYIGKHCPSMQYRYDNQNHMLQFWNTLETIRSDILVIPNSIEIQGNNRLNIIYVFDHAEISDPYIGFHPNTTTNAQWDAHSDWLFVIHSESGSIKKANNQ